MKPSKGFWASILILVALALCLFVASRSTTRHPVSLIDTQLRELERACASYGYEFNVWPPSLDALTNNTKGIRFIDGSSNPLIDPWGNPLLYAPFQTNTGCGLIISWGADGEPGGTKENRDRVVRLK